MISAMSNDKVGAVGSCIVMGAGAWGTAMSVHLCKNGLSVVLVPWDETEMQAIREYGENRLRLPGVKLPENLCMDTHFERYLRPTTVVFIACRVQGLRTVCQKLKPYEAEITDVISLVKGLDEETFQTPSQVIGALLPKVNAMCLTGPTLAKEFAEGKPAAMILASHSERRKLQAAFSSENVCIYCSNDVAGAELGGCLKNIYAIGAGILDGLELGDNARAAYLTCALKEICDIGVYLGGHRETFYGLSGLGDLLTTAQSGRSRRFGFEFAKGQSPETLLREATVEGYASIRRFHERLRGSGIDTPILDGLYAVFYEQVAVEEIIRCFMSRPLRNEA